MTGIFVSAAIIVIIMTLACWYSAIMRNAEGTMEEMMGAGPEKSVPKLEQARVLEELGVRIVPEERKRELLIAFGYSDNEYLASHPYFGFLIMAGSRGILDCVYSTGDWECICQSDSYGKILERLKQISGLPIEAIEGRDRYQVSFRLYGNSYLWKARKNRAFMDCGLGGYVNRILDRQKDGEKKRFFLDSSHDAPVFLFAEDTMVWKLNFRTGLRFHMARACHEREGRIL